MAANTSIEWADDTVNFWHGCTQISPGCDHCYAMELSARFKTVVWNGAPAERIDRAREDLQASHRRALRSGKTRAVFVNSMGDTFDKLAPDHWRQDLFRALRFCPGVVGLILTKRIGNVLRMMDAVGAWPSNAWLGITVVNQEEADRDIPKLLTAKKVFGIPRVFLSIEPMLGPIDLSAIRASDAIELDALRGWATVGAVDGIGGVAHEAARLDWVICGGESGGKARPMHPAWARSLRDQCTAAGVPYFFKQWGEWIGTRATDPKPTQSAACHQWNGGVSSWRVGKGRAGRLLDGVEHNARPELARRA